MEAPDFWDNPERSQKMMKELSTLKEDIQIYQKLETQKEEIELMIEMGYEENDASVIPEIQDMLDEFQADILMKIVLNNLIIVQMYNYTLTY